MLFWTEYLQYPLTTLGEDVLLSSMAGWDFLREKMLKLLEALFCYMLKIWMFFRLTRTTSLSYRSKQNRGSMNKLLWSVFQFRQSDKHLRRIDMSPIFFCTNMGCLQLLDWFYRFFVEYVGKTFNAATAPGCNRGKQKFGVGIQRTSKRCVIWVVTGILGE